MIVIIMMKMTSVLYEEWWNSMLRPNIPSNSVIVMDIAPYHINRKEFRAGQ